MMGYFPSLVYGQSMIIRFKKSKFLKQQFFPRMKHDTYQFAAGLEGLRREQHVKVLAQLLGVLFLRLNSRLGNRGPRSFDSKFRNHCTKKLDGALRKSTLYI